MLYLRTDTSYCMVCMYFSFCLCIEARDLTEAHFSFFSSASQITMATTSSSTAAGTKRKATTKAGGSSKGGYDVPWVEKYRPRTLDDVVGNDDTLVRLRAIAEDGNMPNLILCGPPGTGKVRFFICGIYFSFCSFF